MKTQRLWAYFRQFLLFTVFGVGNFTALAVNAQSETALWEYPGTHKFQGTPKEGCELLSQKPGVHFDECMAGTLAYRKGECKDGYLQDGEVVTTTFTRADGAHHSKTLRVAFKYPKGHVLAGESLPRKHPTRRIVNCPVGQSGFTVALPDACGNWTSYQQPVPKLKPSAPKMVCRQVPINSYFKSDTVQYLSSFVLENCGNDSYTPSVNFHLSDNVTSSGYTEVCDWE